MKTPQIPANELDRQKDLECYGILGTPAERSFDDLTHLASLICKTPVALITLIDKDRQWFKSKVGAEITETPRSISICGHAINNKETMIVADLLEDARFNDNPIVTATGARFYAGAPLVSPSGHALGTLCVLDLTPRELATDQLAALESLARQVVIQLELRKTNDALAMRAEKNAAILRSSKFAIIATDLKGTIFTFNREAERVLGYSADELIGKKTPEIFHDRSEVVKVAEELSKEFNEDIKPGFGAFVYKAAKGSFDDRQWTFITKDGNKVQVQLNISALHNAHGDVCGYLGTAKDLTHELELQEVIETQKIKLISSAKMVSLGEVAAGIAHEINNPISIVTGRAGLLLEMMEMGRDIPLAKMKDSLQQIMKHAFRASKIVMGLKALSRNAEGDPFVRSSVAAVANDSLELIKEKFKNHGVGLQIDFVDADFLGRGVQISQVLTNLLNNSFDAVSILDDKWVRIDSKVDENKIRISVTDSGLGIPKAVQLKLMQPFFTTKEIGKGTGLGLSISRQIAQEHGGNFYLDSHSKNTRFVLELPVAEAEVVKA
jgi:PAS domain S-box-containing protein